MKLCWKWWDWNNIILLNLLRVLPQAGLEVRAMEGSPSVAELFTCIHFVRLVFVFEDALSLPSLQLGINIACVDKGLADSAPTDRFAHPGDIKKAALDFPKMNFVVYHSGMRHGYRAFNQGATPEYVKADAEKLGGLKWTRDLCRDRDQNPKMTNVCCEIGSVFAMCVGDPVMAHLLGSLARRATARSQSSDLSTTLVSRIAFSDHRFRDMSFLKAWNNTRQIGFDHDLIPAGS